MKRFHMHVAVDDIERNVRFYSTLFGAEPAVRKPDYAKWMLDDPRVNFAISTRGARAGLDHVDGEVLPALHPLLDLPNVVLTPHIGGATYDVEVNQTRMIVDDIRRVLAGEPPAHLANPEVLLP